MNICILGAGLSSFALAKALVNKKIHVEIFLKRKKFLINKTRTLGISKSNIDFFSSKIIDIDKILWKLNKIEIFTENLSNEELIKFSANIEEVCVKTVESGSMTKDLAILIDRSAKYLTTNQFLEAIDRNLKKKLN